ncbi:hypothetical protein E2C01_074716 [Portunus trituberculatus]|uniref:Uncharacterized protein n=1 Tax=Portunus trituberculatus TaxID=210409 RepID=A0A5B7IF07_PORTR|nr:hypothetical protein [Portunus trituberculatus]
MYHLSNLHHKALAASWHNPSINNA